MTLVSHGMNPGYRDDEIELQTAVKSQDPDTGEELITWVPTLTLFAEWLPGISREGFAAQDRLQTRVDGVFRVEYIDRPQPDAQRILYEGLLYDIKPPEEIGRRDGWLIPVVTRETKP